MWVCAPEDRARNGLESVLHVRALPVRVALSSQCTGLTRGGHVRTRSFLPWRRTAWRRHWRPRLAA